MMNYIKAECGRLAKKKSNYIFYGSLMVLFTVISFFIQGEDRTPDTFYSMITMMLPLVMMILTIQTFISVYADDVSGRVLATSLSSGVSKSNLVISKVIVSLIYSIVVFLVLAIFLVVHLFLFGGSFDTAGMSFLELMVKQSSIMILAILTFNSIGSIILYLSQKTTIGITFLSMLVFSILTQIVSLLSMLFSPLSKVVAWFPDNLYQSLYGSLNNSEFEVKYLVGLLIYLVASTIISTVVLRNKELEI